MTVSQAEILLVGRRKICLLCRPRAGLLAEQEVNSIVLRNQFREGQPSAPERSAIELYGMHIDTLAVGPNIQDAAGSELQRGS